MRIFQIETKDLPLNLEYPEPKFCNDFATFVKKDTIS